MLITNCPNCGATLKSDVCQYCGAVFIDWSVIDFDKPVFIKFKHNNKVYRAKCIPKEANFNFYGDNSCVYSDDVPFINFYRTRPEISLTLEVISDKGIDFMIIDKNVCNPDDLKDIWKENNND